MARHQHVNDPPCPVEKYIPCSLFFYCKRKVHMRLWIEKVRQKKSVVLVLDCVWPKALSLGFRVLHLTKKITVQLLDTNKGVPA